MGKTDICGKVAETKGYYASRPIITYFPIYMAIIPHTWVVNVGGNYIEVYDAKIPIEATTRLVCSP